MNIIFMIICGFLGFNRVPWYIPGVLGSAVAVLFGLIVNSNRQQLGLDDDPILRFFAFELIFAYAGWGIGWVIQYYLPKRLQKP